MKDRAQQHTRKFFQQLEMCTIHLILEIGYTQVLKHTHYVIAQRRYTSQELHPTTPDSDSAKQYKNHP